MLGWWLAIMVPGYFLRVKLLGDVSIWVWFVIVVGGYGLEFNGG